MKKLLSNNNRKGISEMVSYVLLVIIAVAAAGIVFAYLELRVPKDQLAQCPPEIGVIVQNYSCNYESGKTNFTLAITNKGLFTVDAVYLRFEKAERRIKQNIGEQPLYMPSEGLLPGESYQTPVYNVARIVDSDGNYEVEVQAAVYTGRIKEGYPLGKELAVCENAVISQPVVCS